MIYLIVATGHAYTNDEAAAKAFEAVGFKRVDIATYKLHAAKCRRAERRELKREQAAERKAEFDDITRAMAAEAVEEAKAFLKGDL